MFKNIDIYLSSNLLRSCDTFFIYDAGFGGEGSSGNPCSTTYRGLSYESEVEAKVIADLVRDKMPVLFMDIHSYTQKLLFPYGYKLDNATTRSALESAGNAAAAEMYKIENMTYSVGSSSQDLYINSGSSKDWAYDAGVAYSYKMIKNAAIRDMIYFMF